MAGVVFAVKTIRAPGVLAREDTESAAEREQSLSTEVVAAQTELAERRAPGDAVRALNALVMEGEAIEVPNRLETPEKNGLGWMLW